MSIFSKISASHYILPKNILTQDDLLARFDEKKVKSIAKLTGIKNRRIAAENVTAVDLAECVSQRLINSENFDKNSFDMLIFVSQTRDYILPLSACVLHKRLGLPETCAAIDLPMGCTSMPYALSVANGFIASGQCKKILLVFSETISKLIHPKNLSLLALHGDGAAAFVIEPSTDTGLGFVHMGTDSSAWQSLIVPAGGMRLKSSDETKAETLNDSGYANALDYLMMDGPGVFHFSISKIPGEIQKALANNSAKISDYNLVLLHQANKMMLEQIYALIGAKPEQMFFFFENIGNLSAASLPVALAEALRQGKLSGGGNILMAAFGVGLSWGICSMNFAANSVKISKAPTDF